MNYQYPNDNKLHTRFSELSKCTPGQIQRVIDERNGDLAPFENEITYFGEKRHEMFSKYIKENGHLPKQFGLELECKPDQSERHIACEVAPQLVIHGTPDAFGADWVIDFKTTTKPEAYVNSKQCTFYAWLLGIYGLEIKKVYYLCEVWNLERDKILEYKVHEKEITPEDIEEVKEWALDRARFLYKSIKLLERNGKEKARSAVASPVASR